MNLRRPIFCALLLATPLMAQRNQSPAGDGHTWHLKREERSAPLTDWNTHQTRTFKMLSMLVPEGWQLDVRPGPNFAKLDCADMSGRVMVSVTSPDKSTGIFVIPTSASMWTTDPRFLQQKKSMLQNFSGGFACQIEQPKPLSVSMPEAAPKLFPGARIVGQVGPVPGLSEEIPQIVAGANAHGGHITAEAGQLRLSGPFQGKQVDMYLVSLSTHRTESIPGGGSVTYNDLPLAAVIYAPPGQLDQNDKLLMTLLGSLEIAPEWTKNNQVYVARIYEKINGAYATVARIHQQMQQDNANAAAQQQAIRNNTANYRSQVMSSVARSRSAALDHTSQQFALYMGDQAIYKDPSTGQHVQMSSGYNHVWASTTGNTSDFILTDSASYDPNGHAGSASWTQMQVEH